MIAAAASSRTVLIASASIGVRDRFARALLQAGYRTLTTARTSDLLGALDTARPAVDLLLLDLGLADGEGVSLIRCIRDDAGSLPIIAFAQSVTSAYEVFGLEALGVTGYVNEHLDAQEILPSLARHLRSSARVVLEIPMFYRFSDTIGSAQTLNISKGGLAIRTMSPLTVSTEVRARFQLPGAGREVSAYARVVWSHRRVGMGLQFELLAASEQTAVDEYVSRHDPG